MFFCVGREETYQFQAVPTALKHSMLTGDVILRFCNLSDGEDKRIRVGMEYCKYL